MVKGLMIKLMATVCAFFLCVGAASAYATWIYPEAPSKGMGQVGIQLQEFVYKPDEVLPDDGEASAQQKNHLDVVNELLFNSKMGANTKNALTNAIKKEGLLNYLETIQGGNLKHLIDSTDGGKNLGFVMVYVDETQFYAYTFYRLNHTGGERIVVYKTLIKQNSDPTIDVDKNGKMDDWVAYSSLSGTAEATVLSGNQYTIIVDTWQAGVAS